MRWTLPCAVLVAAACSSPPPPEPPRREAPVAGTTCKSPIDIQGATDANQLASARAWIARHHPGAAETARSLASCNGETREVIDLKLAGGAPLRLYFRYLSPAAPSDPLPVTTLHAVFRDGKASTVDLDRRVFENPDFMRGGRFNPGVVSMMRLQYATAAGVWAWEIHVRGDDRAQLAADVSAFLRRQPEICLVLVGRQWEAIPASELAPCAAGAADG